MTSEIRRARTDVASEAAGEGRGPVAEGEALMRRPRLDRLEELAADELLQDALDAGDVGIWSWDFPTDTFAADPVARRLWGLPERGSVPIRQVLGAIVPEDAPAVRAAAIATRNTGVDCHVIFRVRHPSRGLRWLRVRGRRTIAASGGRLVGVTIDITERKRTEAELTATEARLRRAQELGGALPFEWDARTDAFVAGGALKALYGLAPEAEMTLASMLERVHPEDRSRVEADYLHRMQHPGHYEGEFRVALDGGETRWVLSRGETLLDSAGRPAGLAGVHIDITRRKNDEDELRRSKRDARARFRELKALYQNAPVGLALLDRHLAFTRVNECFAELNGLPADRHLGRPIFELFPGMREKLEPVLREVLETGEAKRNLEVAGSKPGRPDDPILWRTHYYALKDEKGAILGIGVVAEDITARRKVERSRDLLGRELSHRIKNLFAVVSSLVGLSARGQSEEVQAFARTIRGRIEALGRAHDVVRPNEWVGPQGGGGTTLHRLLEILLAPYRGDGERVKIFGDDVAIGPQSATTLALAMHEFATNAVKYGALSVPAGAVDIHCRTADAGVEILWTERGGPPVQGPPERSGFGSLLASRSISGDLAGKVDIDWNRQGLAIRILAPADRLAR